MVTNTNTFIDGPCGKIESLIQVPENSNTRSIAVLCHPLPTAGGSMHNKVVYTMGRACHGLGLATIKFNTRGTGMSEGIFDGRKEISDLASVVDYACKKLAAGNIWLGGFSFGSYLAYSLSRQWNFQARLVQLLLIAPPVDRYDYGAMEKHNCSMLLVQGAKDELVDSECVYSWYKEHNRLYDSSDYVLIAEASHFFHGTLTELHQQVESHLLMP